MERFDLNNEPEPIPQEAMKADPAQMIRDLYGRIARLEQGLDAERRSGAEERSQAAEAQHEVSEDNRELLQSVLELHDEVAEAVERYGVTTSAQEAGIIRGMIGFGRLLQGILARHEVVPIDTIGRPFDEETSQVVETEPRDEVQAGTVLREVRVGYRWPQGLIRKAQVVVSGSDETVSASQDSKTE